jgi:hypothetical protein
MIKREIGIALAVLTLTIFVSCTSQHRSGPGGPSSQNETPPSAVPSAPRSQGTVDSGGGGNTYEGRPLESYIQKITDLPAYKNQIAPILANLESNNRLAMAFTSMVEGKTWYLIPGDLNKLPDTKIGSAVATEQAALQDFKQVWLNTKIFDAMKEDDQAKLILHEILIGLRILQFDSAKEECQRFYPDAVGKCHSLSTVASGRPTDLSKEDYALVRSVGGTVYGKFPEFRQKRDAWLKQIEDWLSKAGFQFRYYQLDRLMSDRKISRTEFLKMLDEAMVLGLKTSHGYDVGQLLKVYPELKDHVMTPKGPYIWTSTSRCQIDIQMDGKTVWFRFASGDRRIEKRFAIENYQMILTDNEALTGEWVSSVGLRSEPQSEPAKYPKGSPNYAVDLEFVGQEIRNVSIYQSTCLSDGCSSESGIDGGLPHFFCSSRREIRYK